MTIKQLSDHCKGDCIACEDGEECRRVKSERDRESNRAFKDTKEI